MPQDFEPIGFEYQGERPKAEPVTPNVTTPPTKFVDLVSVPNSDAKSAAFEAASYYEAQAASMYRNKLEAKRRGLDKYGELPGVKNLVDNLGSQGIGWYRSFIGKMGAKFGEFVMASKPSFMHSNLPLGTKLSMLPVASNGNPAAMAMWLLTPNDISWNIRLNYSTDLSSGGPEDWAQLNNKEAIDRELDAAGVREEDRPALIGMDENYPKTYGEFQYDLAVYMITDDRMYEKSGWVGAGAGFLADTAGIAALGGTATVPIGSALGRIGLSVEAQSAIAAGTAHLSRTRSAISLAAAGTIETGAIQSIREGINPHSNPSFSEILFELTVGAGFAGGAGGLFGGRGLADAVRSALRMQPQSLQTLASPNGTVAALPVNGRWGWWVSGQIDEGALLGSRASMIDNIAGVADDAFDLANRGIRDGNLLGMLLSDAVDAGIPITKDLSRQLGRALITKYDEGLRGAALRDAVITDVEGVLAPATDLASITTWRRAADGTDVSAYDNLIFNSEKLPARGHAKDVIEADDKTLKRMARFSPTADVIRKASHKAKRRLTEEEVEKILSRLYIASKNRWSFNAVASDLVREISGTTGRVVWTTNTLRRWQLTTQGMNSQAPFGAVGAVPPVPGTVMGSVGNGGGGGNVPVPPSGVPGATPTIPTMTVPYSSVSPGAAWSSMNDSLPWLSDMSVLPVQTQFNQPAALLNHTNPMARVVGMTGYTRRVVQSIATNESVAQPYSIFEQGTHELNGYLVDWQRSLSRRRLQHANGVDADARTTQTGRALTGIRDDINRDMGRRNRAMDVQVFRLIRRNQVDRTSRDPVHVLASEVQDLLARMYNVASQVGVPGFRNAADPSYMPRILNLDFVRQLASTRNGQNELYEFVRRSMHTDDVGGIPARRVIWDDGTVEILTDLDDAARIYTDAIINKASDAGNAPLGEWEMEVFDAINRSQGPLAGGTAASPVNRGKGRVFMNETISMPITSRISTGHTVLDMETLASTDLNVVMRQYGQTVQGAINERRAVNMVNEHLTNHNIMAADGNFLQIESLRETIGIGNRIAREFGFEEINATTQENIDNVIGALRYRPTDQHQIAPFARNNWRMSQVGGWLISRSAEEFMGISQHLSFWTFGGKFAMNQVSEIGRTMGMFGIWNTVRNIPTVANLMGRAWYNMNDDARNVLATIDAIWHPNVDGRLRQVFMSHLNEPGFRFGNMSNYVGQRGSHYFASISGLHQTQSFQQMLSNVAAVRHLIDVSRGAARRLDDQALRLLGLEPAQYDNMVAWVGANVQIQRRWLGEVPIGFNNYTDPEFFQMVGFVDRAVRHNIQDITTPMDFGKWAFTPLGRLFTEMRKFNLKAMDNFYGGATTQMRSFEIATAHRLFTSMLYTGIIGGLIKHAYAMWQREKAAENGDWDEVTRLDKELTLEGFVKKTANMVTELWPVLVAGDILMRGLGNNENMFSTSKNHPLDPMATPQMNLWGRWITLADVPMSSEKEMTVERWGQLARTLPMVGLPFLEDMLEDDIENWARRTGYLESDSMDKSPGWIEGAMKKIPF